MPVDDDEFKSGIRIPPPPREKLAYEPPENEVVARMIAKAAEENKGWKRENIYTYLKGELEGTGHRVTQEMVNFVLACPCRHLHNLEKGS